VAAAASGKGAGLREGTGKGFGATRDGGRAGIAGFAAAAGDSEGGAASIFDERRAHFREADDEPDIFRVCWKQVGVPFLHILPIKNKIPSLFELL
jgi:hypothetical protein